MSSSAIIPGIHDPGPTYRAMCAILVSYQSLYHAVIICYEMLFSKLIYVEQGSSIAQRNTLENHN